MSVVALVLCLIGAAPGNPSLCGGIIREPLAPTWCADARLQTSLSPSFGAKPLREAVAALAVPQVSLECADTLSEQRVLVYGSDVPVWRLMLRLADVLSHGEVPGRHVEWVRKDEDGRLTCRLIRTHTGESALRTELQTPDRRAVEWLFALGRYATGATKPGDDGCPVVRDLTRAGTPTEVVPLLDALRVADEDELTKLVAQGDTVIGADRMPTPSRLRASRAPLPGMFDVTLVTRDGPDRHEEVGFVFDTLGVGPPDHAVIEEERRRDGASGPRVTLRDPSDPHGALAATDLAGALSAWAFSTGRAVVAEVFMRDRVSLSVTTGAPDELLTGICRAFWCDWRKVGDVYVVWSKTWALDVSADVSVSRIASWDADLDAGGERGLRATVAMARLSDPRLATAIRSTGTNWLMTPSVLRACRLLAALADGAMNSALKRRTRLWRPSRAVVSLASEVVGTDAREPIALRLRPEPDRTAYLLELTCRGRATPAVVRMPTRRDSLRGRQVRK